MKLKIKKRRINSTNIEAFDVYHGFFSWFRIKWIGERYGLTDRELSEYIDNLVVKLRTNVKIIWDL